MNETIKLLKYLETLPQHQHHNIDEYLKRNFSFKDGKINYGLLVDIEDLGYIHMEEFNVNGDNKYNYQIAQNGIDYLLKVDSENNTSKVVTLTKWGYIILPIMAIIVPGIWSYINYNHNVELKSKDMQIETSKNSSYKKDSVIAKQKQTLILQNKKLDSLNMLHRR